MSALPVAIAAGAVVISGLSAFALCGRVKDQERALVQLEGRVGDALAPPASDAGAGEEQARLTRLAEELAGLEERLARLESSPRREVEAALAPPSHPERSAGAP